MNRATLLNIGLLLLVGALITLVRYQTDEGRTGVSTPLTSLTTSEVKRIEIQRLGRDTIELQKTDTQWRLLRPTDHPANTFRVGALLELTTTPSRSRYSVNEADLAALGLEPAQITLQLDQLTLRFGDSEPLNHYRYVIVGETIHLIDDLTYLHLSADWSRFVSPTLLSAERLNHIALPDRTLQLDSDQHWQLSPSEIVMDGDAITALVESWQGAEAIEVTPYRDEPSIATITLTPRGGDTITLKMLATTPELILARAELGIRYHFSAEQAAALLPNLTTELK